MATATSPWFNRHSSPLRFLTSFTSQSFDRKSLHKSYFFILRKTFLRTKPLGPLNLKENRIKESNSLSKPNFIDASVVTSNPPSF